MMKEEREREREVWARGWTGTRLRSDGRCIFVGGYRGRGSLLARGDRGEKGIKRGRKKYGWERGFYFWWVARGTFFLGSSFFFFTSSSSPPCWTVGSRAPPPGWFEGTSDTRNRLIL